MKRGGGRPATQPDDPDTITASPDQKLKPTLASGSDKPPSPPAMTGTSAVDYINAALGLPAAAWQGFPCVEHDTAPFQLFDPLRDEEYEALKADIAKRGVLVPVEYDEHGNVLDGHHRIRACEELGITEFPSVTRTGLDEAGKQEHVLKLNLLRRHLGPIRFADAFRRLAALRGVELGQGARNDKATSATVAEVAAELGIPERTARHRLQVADTLQSRPDLAEQVDTGRIGTTEALRQVRQEAKRDRREAKAAAIDAEPLTLPTGPFRVIVADPPWTYDARGEDPTNRATPPYPCMQTGDIRAMRVATLACDDAVLWLWTTNAHMADAFTVAAAWGFQQKTILTWVKDKMGAGAWLRGQTEHCLMAVRGRPVVRLTNQTTVLHAPRRAHSQKPDEFYRLVETLCPGSKVELFSRTPREGWVGYGDEIVGTTHRDLVGAVSR